jgi:DNA repair protein RecO (recombination protein O)
VPEESVAGIVLRRKDSGESDRRLTLLTKEFGKIDVVAKGARKPSSRLSGSTEPFSVAVFCLATRAGAGQRRNSFLTQAQPSTGFRGLRADYDRLCLALALIELFAVVLPFEEPNAEAYDLLFASLQSLERHSKPAAALVWAEVALLEISGFSPQFLNCVECGDEGRGGEGALSPEAGGFLCPVHERECSDRFYVRGEVLIALGRISMLAEPPENLKFSDACLHALAPFWRRIADAPLPALESLLNHLHSERLSAG